MALGFWADAIGTTFESLQKPGIAFAAIGSFILVLMPILLNISWLQSLYETKVGEKSIKLSVWFYKAYIILMTAAVLWLILLIWSQGEFTLMFIGPLTLLSLMFFLDMICVLYWWIKAISFGANESQRKKRRVCKFSFNL